jgi:hypothetical protein
MLQQDKPDDFVLATGEMRTVREFVEESFKFVGTNITWIGEGVEEIGVDEKNHSRVLVRVDPAYFRPTEVRRTCICRSRCLCFSLSLSLSLSLYLSLSSLSLFPLSLLPSRTPSLYRCLS